MCVFVCVYSLDSLSPTNLVMEVLRTLCDRTECAVECLYQIPVIETLLAPVITLLKGKLVSTTWTFPSARNQESRHDYEIILN